MNLLSCLQSFVTIANSQSFSVAARKLYVSPSKLSKEISWLEHKLGTKLFIRSTRQLTLTEHGKILYTKAVKVFNEVEQLKEIAKPQTRELQGKLRIYVTVTPAIPYLTKLCLDFMADNPKIELAFLVGAELLTPGEDVFDMAISFEDISHPKYQSDLLFSVRRVIYGTPAYFKKHGEITSPDQLMHHNCLINTLYGLQNKWILGKKVVQVGGSFQSNNATVLKQAALSDLGLIWVPPFTVKDEVQQGLLKAVLTEDISPEIPLYYIVPKHMATAKSIVALVQYVQERAKQDGLTALE